MGFNPSPPDFEPPPQEFIDSITNVSYPVKTLLWYGLSTKTRQGYDTAISSNTLFCATRGVISWPASELILAEWIAGRVFGSNMVKQNRITANTIQSYLSALRSYHIDHHLSIDAFSSPLIDRMLKGARHIYPHSKKECLSITKDILVKITSTIPISIEEINIDTAFKVAWAGFLRLGEITYSNAEAQAPTFVNTKLTRSDITFAEDNQQAILRLKRSKTDLYHTGVEIILAATHDKTCPVTALHTLFSKDPQPRIAPLFRLTGKSTAFDRNPVINMLQKRLQAHNINMPKSYTGHSFRKGAAQHASDNGMLDQHIQKLGRWTSQAFQLYFETSASSLYTLSKRFQTGQSNTQP